MVAVLTMGATSLFAQKFGQIDQQMTLYLMPEIANVQTELQKVQAEYMEVIEGMQVERNKLVDEISKFTEATSETTRQLKNRQYMDAEQRIQDYAQSAQEAMQKAEEDLVKPLVDRLSAAIAKIAKQQGLLGVFQTGAMPFLDETQVVDISTAVRAELGIAADATLPATPVAAQ